MPVLAKVDGVCVGAGLGLALAADLIWCSDRARFSAIFAKRGLSLDFGTSWLLRQRIGVHRAKELAFTAKIIGAADALTLGLVNAVVPAADLDAATDEVVQTIAAGPPVALSMTKRELDHASHASLVMTTGTSGGANFASRAGLSSCSPFVATTTRAPPGTRRCRRSANAVQNPAQVEQVLAGAQVAGAAALPVADVGQGVLRV